MNVEMTYDEKTTALISKWESYLAEYELVLTGDLQRRRYHPQAAGLAFRDDPGRREIIKVIGKIRELAIPIKMEIKS